MDDPTAESGGSQSPAQPLDTSPPLSAPAGSAEHSGAGGARPGQPPMRGPLFIVVAVLLLLASAFVAFTIFKRKPVAQLSQDASPKPTSQPTKSFRDATTGIAFDYPADWSQL